MSDNTSILPESVIDLLHYILLSPKFNIETVQKSKFNDILSLSKQTAVKSSSMPNHIFKVNYVGELRMMRNILKLCESCVSRS